MSEQTTMLTAKRIMMQASDTPPFPATQSSPDSRNLSSDETIFRPGEPVVYRAHGIGCLGENRTLMVGGTVVEMLQVTFAKNALLLLIPCETAARSGLRHIGSSAGADDAYATIVGRRRTLGGVWAKKGEMISRKINTGRLDQMAEVVRDLRHHAGSLDGSFSERQLFNTAFERMTEELTAISGGAQSDTTERVRSLLLEAELTQKKPVASDLPHVA